jgi:multicomponent Na+:H+ antiporter subunit E
MITVVVLNLLLALMWCFLLEKFDVGTFVAGNLVAALVQWIFRRVRGPEMEFLRRAFRPGKLWVLSKLALYFMYEMVKSNLQVAWLIWQPRLRVQSALIRIPIELENDLSIALLANMISLTPGTVTMDVADDRKALIVHCLNVDDIADTKRVIKTRFEQPLRELEQ